MNNLVALLCGLLFGLGLILSGMADPAKVLNFLDITGNWDPSLAFVMGGAIVVTAPAFRVLRRQPAPMFGIQFHWPVKAPVDAPLLIGAALFGLGWGLSGFCPGPAIVALPLMAPGTLIFIPAILIGMALARARGRSLIRPSPS